MERHSHHADSAHVEDFIKGKEGTQSTPLERREEERRQERGQRDVISWGERGSGRERWAEPTS